MAYKPKEKIEITCSVVKVIHEVVGEHRATRIRIVDWGVGDKTYRLLEKREFYNKDGQEMSGKAKGFSFEDLGRLHTDFEEIMEIMSQDTPVKVGGEFPV